MCVCGGVRLSADSKLCFIMHLFLHYMSKVFLFVYFFFRKDGSKEPIVEMRTEDERITNHEDGSPVNEPNETTPLTEPE